MNFVVIDTDVASQALRGRLPTLLKSQLAGASVCISFVTLGELTKWTIVRSWGPQRLAHLAAWRRNVVLLPFNAAVATTWGGLQARAQQRGRPRPVNDTWVAACCLVDQLPLMTLNIKDFEDFAAHDGLRLITP